MKKLKLNLLTESEQKVLLFLLFVILLGSILSLLGYSPQDRLAAMQANQNKATLDSLITINHTPRFDLNHVTYEELLFINGIGPAIASSIIDYRENIGFQKLEDLLNIRGIGASRLASFSEYLYLHHDTQTLNSVSTVETLNSVSLSDQNPSAPIIEENRTTNRATPSPPCRPNCRRVHINRASKDELMTLRGVGPVRADDIILYRTTHGNFRTLDEIKNVRGIGERTFENIKDFICIGDNR